ncbi:hypothetical protein PT161_05460 [Erysipelothrix rhusiopathiae]|nr:hypothetical protein [Erysipelothrix rhusiopathiae]
MLDWVGQAMDELWRTIMWGIMEFSLGLQSSFVKDVIIPASKLTFLKSDIVSSGYDMFSLVAVNLLVVVVLFLLVMATIKGELEKKVKHIIIGALCSVLLIGGTKPFILWAFEGVSEASIHVTSNEQISSLDDEVVRITIAAANPKMSEEKTKAFVSEFNQPDFDYNQKEGKDYKFTLNPFPTMIISFIVLFLLIYIALQILFRGLSIGGLLTISPFATITLVTDNNQGWRFVVGQFANGLFMTAMQMWILIFSMVFIAEMKSSNFFLQLLVLIVGFLFVIQFPTIVSGITGGSQGSLLQSAQSALMGANAGRALMAGVVGSAMATASGLGNMFKGAFTGRGKGTLGNVGNVASAPLRFASGAIKGEGKTILGNEGTKANKMGAKTRSQASNLMQYGGLKASSNKEEVGDDGNNKTNDTSNTNNSSTPYDKQEAQRMTSQDLNPEKRDSSNPDVQRMTSKDMNPTHTENSKPREHYSGHESTKGSSSGTRDERTQRNSSRLSNQYTKPTSNDNKSTKSPGSSSTTLRATESKKTQSTGWQGYRDQGVRKIVESERQKTSANHRLKASNNKPKE